MSRRRASIDVSCDFLVELCKPGRPRYAEVVENALPEDARLIADHALAYLDTVRLTVESEAFAEVPLDEACPHLPPPVFRVIYQPDGATVLRQGEQR